MHRSNSQSGQTLLVVMVAIVPIFLVVGLVVDVGMAYFTKTSARAAAQTAALAAVQAAIDGISTEGWSYTCGDGPACESSLTSCTTSLPSNLRSACAYAEANGFAASNILVAAEDSSTPPPVTGVKNVNYWVQVQITQQNPLTFGIFSGLQKLNVTASAVAAAANMMPLNCVVALDGGMSLYGNPTVNISGCGIGVDADLSATGSVEVQAPWVQVAGTYDGSGVSPTPVTVPHFPDPLEGVPAPTVPDDCNHPIPLTSNGTTVYYPGEYCGGISVGKNSSAVFNPGMYYLKGDGLSANGTASLSGQNVTFYNTCNPSPCSSSSDGTFGPITTTGNTTVELSAPVTAADAASYNAMQGILFFEDRSAPQDMPNSIYGNSDLELTGAIYFPQNALTFYGNGTIPSQALMMVAHSISMHGDVKLLLNPQPTSGPPITPQVSAALIQ
ncbi:MAG: pilus assembly protein TadG-related protein [Candidatus Acidiferrales bacterium]